MLDMKKIRLMVAIEGSLFAVRAMPHKTDKTKIVLKAGHPEAAGALCQFMRVKPGNMWKGTNFFITEVGEEDFAKALPGFFQAVMLQARALDLAAQKALPAAKCEDCGTDDGTHWKFCGTGLSVVG